MRLVIFTLVSLTIATQAFATQAKKTLEIRMQSPTGNVSDATMYFDQGITPAYNNNADAEMVFANIPGIPQMYTLTTDNIPCSINGAGDLSSPTVIPVGYKVGYPGNYTISGILLSNFDATSIITLEDRQLGITTDLRENFYEAQLDTNDKPTGRFFIHVSTPVKFSSVNSNCQNTAGSITINTDTSVTWSQYQLISGGQAVSTISSVGAVVNFPNLAAGDYQVVFTYNQYNATENFHLNGNYIVASIATPQSIAIHENVTFNALTTNTDQYQWNFGDGTLIDGVANPEQTYLVPGNYVINLTCSNNYGCSATAQANVSVTVASGISNQTENAISVTVYNKQITVNMNGNISSNAELMVTNLLGQQLYSQPITNQNETVSMGNVPAGYYLVSVKNAGKVSTKRVFMAN